MKPNKRQFNVLDVNLHDKSYFYYPLPAEFYLKYLGGAGINAKILFDELNKNVEPLSPDNLLIIGAGPLVGTNFPCSGRFTITTKSPITHIYADSNAGGFFGARMCQLGINHIIFRGKLKDFSYIYIGQDKVVHFVDAECLRGKNVIETNDILRERHAPCETLRIGPAGENLVLYSNIASGTTRLSYHGRTGVGAVMGSKNIKAIVLETGGLKQIDPENDTFSQLVKQYKDTIKNSNGCQYRSTTGTLNIMTAFNTMEDNWERNYQEFVPEEKGKSLEPENFLANYYTGKKSGCWNCLMPCSLQWQIKDGKYKGLKGEKIEFGHTYPLGVNLGIFDFDRVLYLSDLANKLGLDSMELGFTLGFLSEAMQRGLLTKKDVGFKVNWGDADAYTRIIELIIKQEGIGKILSQGVKAASEYFGDSFKDFAFHYKGQAYRIEKNQSWALAFTVSPRGGDHLKSMAFASFAYGTPHAMKYMFADNLEDRVYDMHDPYSKGRYVWWHENYKTIADCLGLCIFPLINLFLNGEAQIRDLVSVYNSAVNTDLTEKNFWKASERIFQIMKLFNTLLGMDRKFDQFPRRKTNDLKNGFDHDSVQINDPGMLDEYYYFRGYSRDGYPTRQRLSEVNLEEMSGILEKQNLIRDEDVYSLKGAV